MYGLPEHVLVENEWYDGPRVGTANVNGAPHRFVSQWDEEVSECLGTFLVWPVNADEIALEQEQWRIFVNWNDQYEAGEVDTSTHPGNPGVDKRWAEIDSLLAASRNTVPASAMRAKAQIFHLEQAQRYAPTGPAYQLCWKLL